MAAPRHLPTLPCALPHRRWRHPPKAELEVVGPVFGRAPVVLARPGARQFVVSATAAVHPAGRGGEAALHVGSNDPPAVVDISHIARCPQHLLHEMVRPVEIHIGEELAGQIANRKITPAGKGRKQVTAIEPGDHRLPRVGAVESAPPAGRVRCVRCGHRAGRADCAGISPVWGGTILAGGTAAPLPGSRAVCVPSGAALSCVLTPRHDQTWKILPRRLPGRGVKA